MVLFACVQVPNTIDGLKYSENDLNLLSDLEKSKYYDDAAYIEYGRLCSNAELSHRQVTLDKKSIDHHFENLLSIYNNCYSISNSFFENISEIHTHGSPALYSVIASVDTSKVWIQKWIFGSRTTGILAIDSIVDEYDLEISSIRNLHNRVNVTISSPIPVNYLALIEKLKSTAEFRYVEPNGTIGGGSIITCEYDDISQLYKYVLRWGDCPSGYCHRSRMLPKSAE